MTGSKRFPIKMKSNSKMPQLLKSIRLARGLTQVEVGHRCGLAACYISQIEAGNRTPTIGALRRILDALDASPVERDMVGSILCSTEEAA